MFSKLRNVFDSKISAVELSRAREEVPEGSLDLADDKSSSIIFEEDSEDSEDEEEEGEEEEEEEEGEEEIQKLSKSNCKENLSKSGFEKFYRRSETEVQKETNERLESHNDGLTHGLMENLRSIEDQLKLDDFTSNTPAESWLNDILTTSTASFQPILLEEDMAKKKQEKIDQKSGKDEPSLGDLIENSRKSGNFKVLDFSSSDDEEDIGGIDDEEENLSENFDPQQELLIPDIDMTIPYGSEKDQILKISQYLDEFGNFMTPKAQFYLHSPPPEVTQQIVADSRVFKNHREIVFSKTPNIHHVKIISGLRVGILESKVKGVNVNPRMRESIEALISYPSSTYLYVSRNSEPVNNAAFIQFPFFNRKMVGQSFDFFPNCHKGVFGRLEDEDDEKRDQIHYFEVKIYNGAVTIGLSPEAHPGLPVGIGWSHGSFGFHYDNGSLYSSSYDGLAELSEFRFGPGSVVGCGLDFLTNEIFFTLNGKKHPDVMKCKSKKEAMMFPSIGCFKGCSKNGMICFEINLGEDTIKNPFSFRELNCYESRSHLWGRIKRVHTMMKHLDFKIKIGNCGNNAFAISFSVLKYFVY